MGRRATLFALICAAPASVPAATLPIDGIYGNPAGCTLERTSNYGEDDSARFMTPDSLQTMVTACSFDSVSPVPGGYKVGMTCASEGEGPEENYRDEAEITGDARSGYTVRFADGSSWEPLARC